jgi:AcrR family transcriptional regulator
VSNPATALHWIRPPRQARTQQSLERLLDAAEHLILEKSFDDVHISDIARHADSSVAAFYRRFKDKDALLHALHERHYGEAIATADHALDPERWHGALISEILFTLVPFLIEVVQDHALLDRAILQRALSDEQMRERALKLRRHVVLGLSRLMLDRREEITHPDPETAVSLALIQAVALVTQRFTLAFGEIEPVRMSDERVAHEITTSCLAYLGIENPYAPFKFAPIKGDQP